jgi:hypothetical protein
MMPGDQPAAPESHRRARQGLAHRLLHGRVERPADRGGSVLGVDHETHLAGAVLAAEGEGREPGDPSGMAEDRAAGGVDRMQAEAVALT